MKTSIKLLLGVAVCSATLTTTSCIDETEPTEMILQSQVDKSPNSINAMLMAMPARFNALDARTGNFGDYAFGYGGLMHVRDVQTEDLSVAQSNYDHFSAWETVRGVGENYATAQWLWNYEYESILSCNKLIAAVKALEEPSSSDLGALGAAYATRALWYLDLAREYEFLPNEAFPDGKNNDGNKVEGYTVPIVTDTITEEMARNNPRATHEEMYKFILSDLDSAETYINGLKSTYDKTLPDLACVYGLKARLYMWNEDYPNAYTYANKAIQQSKQSGLSPLTFEDCYITTQNGNPIGYQPTCFNDISKWMWGVKQTADNSTVTSGILNWTSWMTPEYSGGYAGAGACSRIYIPLYNRIAASDWRKALWDADDLVNPGISHKFQPNEGNTTTSTIACATSYPIMRVEEMYFIKAEAAAHQNPSAGKQLLELFMNNYRVLDQSYKCNATSMDDVIEEIIFQKRIELWGEGQTFFDIKRLNYSVDRTKDGSNFYSTAQFKTIGRPGWMNWVIVQSEQNNNKALVGWNNPNPQTFYNPTLGAE